MSSMKNRLLTIFNQTPQLSSNVAAEFYVDNIVHLTALIVTVGFYSTTFLAGAEALASPTNTKSAAVNASKKKVEDLPNFHQVHPFLYRSGEPTEAGLNKLKEMGVKTVIDLRAPTKPAKQEAKYCESIGLKYMNMPMSDKAPTKKQVSTLLETIDAAKKTGEPVIVHCQHGSDRTGCMIGIWRVQRDGWDFDKTYKEMRKYWFGPKYTLLRNAVKERASN